MKKREQIEEKYKWDLTKYCRNDEDFEIRLKKIENLIPKFKEFEGKLSNDDILFECLEFETKIDKETSLLAVYAFLRDCENKADRKANEMNEQISFVSSKLSPATAYIDVEISKFSNVKLNKLTENSKFANYKRYFEAVLREKKHVLSKKEEVLLSKMGSFLGGFSESFDKFNDVDLKFDDVEDSNGKKHILNHSTYSTLVESKDRILRKNAFKEMSGKYGKYINFLATNYINDVKESCTLAKIRKFDSALKASIYAEEASEKVYDMLIKKVRENVSLQHRYFEIKRRMLGLDKIALYDTFAPVVETLDRKYSYEEAIELIKKAVAVLGKDYVDLIDRAKNERWIDVYANENKDSGAFSISAYGANPVVLTNFEGNLEAVFTLAHELGHAIHSYFSEKYQPIQTSNYVIFVAEVASNVNEMLLLKYLLSNADSKEEKMQYFDHFLIQMRGSIFRQTMFAEFEAEVHRDFEMEKPLTAEMLCSKYARVNSFYHGDMVESFDEIQYEWARIHHFYRSFYVYKYAIGLICAIKIANQLYMDKSFAKQYISFLSSGCSADPISLLKLADCDLTKEKVFDEAFDECNKFIIAWEELLK